MAQPFEPSGCVSSSELSASGRMAAVVREIPHSPELVLQRAAAEALLYCRAHSAGISLLSSSSQSDNELCRCAIVGPWVGDLFSRLPGDCSPEGSVLQAGAVRKLREPAQSYPMTAYVQPAAIEMLAVALTVNRQTVGALWTVLHDRSHSFDEVDAFRLLSLGRCTSAAYEVSLTLSAQSRRGHPVSAHLAIDSHPGHRALSRRERQVGEWLARGYSNKAISEILALSPKSVTTYRARLADKLGLRTRPEVVAYALAQGWLARPPF